MVCLGNEQRSFVVFEIAPKYCISDSFLDQDKTGESTLLSRSGGEKGPRCSGAGNLGVLLESDWCVEEHLRAHQGCQVSFRTSRRNVGLFLRSCSRQGSCLWQSTWTHMDTVPCKHLQLLGNPGGRVETQSLGLNRISLNACLKGEYL